MILPGAPRWIGTAAASGWLAQAAGWLETALATAGLVAEGEPVKAKDSPWSLVLRLPTSAGTVWFKANAPALAAESALVPRLARLAPASVPEPLAADPERGWLLLPDHGPTLRSLGRDADPETWVEVVGQWSALSREVSVRPHGLDGLGLPSLGPAGAAAYLAARTDELAGLPATDPDHLPAAAAARLEGAGAAVAEAAEQLAALGLPDTLWHNDLHTDNVFAPGTGDRLAFFDFGDALLGHPLAELLIPLRSATRARGGGLGPPAALVADRALLPVVEAAIEPWTDLAPARELRRCVPAALKLGVLGRSEAWRRALLAADEPARAEYGGASAAWLQELLHD